MADQPQEKLQSLLEDFDAAMLVTRTPQQQLRARPMAVADIEENGRVWFITQRDSGKMDELAHDSHVAVTMQSSQKFVSLSGTVSVVEDRRKVEELWNEAWKVWFPGGKDDPQLVLLTVDATAGEYWDNSGVEGIKYLFEAGKAYLAGRKPNVDSKDIHGKVAL